MEAGKFREQAKKLLEAGKKVSRDGLGARVTPHGSRYGSAAQDRALLCLKLKK